MFVVFYGLTNKSFPRLHAFMTGCILKLMWYIFLCVLPQDKHFILDEIFQHNDKSPFKNIIHGRYLEDGGTGGIDQASMHHRDTNKYLNALKLHEAAWWKTRSSDLTYGR